MELLLIGLFVGYVLGRMTASSHVDNSVEAFKTRMTAAHRLADRNLMAIQGLREGLTRGTVTPGQVTGLANALEDTTDILTDIIDDHGRLLRSAGGEHGGKKAND